MSAGNYHEVRIKPTSHGGSLITLNGMGQWRTLHREYFTGGGGHEEDDEGDLCLKTFYNIGQRRRLGLL